MIIREFDLSERPREKLKLNGVKCLSDSELLALILRTGFKDENVVDLSRRLLNTFGLGELSSCSLNELCSVKGIGFAKACQILALFELAERKVRPSNFIVRSPRDVFLYVKPLVANLIKEHFIILLLNSKNVILKHEIVSVGILDASLVHPREVFRPAIKEGCFAIILVHNHPSGDPSPSDDDLAVTHKLLEASEIMNIKILDHVIVGFDSFWSFKHDNN